MTSYRPKLTPADLAPGDQVCVCPDAQYVVYDVPDDAAGIVTSVDRAADDISVLWSIDGTTKYQVHSAWVLRFR